MTKEFLTEETVNKIVEEFLNKTGLKLQKILIDDSFSEIRDFIDQVYQNAIDEKEQEYINKIFKKYLNDPTYYKYSEIRKCLFEENKENLIKSLTDDAIIKTMENYFLKYTHRDNYFHWQWLDGIANIILENFDKFKDDDRINNRFLRELERRDSKIEALKEEIRDLKNTLRGISDD